MYGKEGLQAHVRNHIDLANLLTSWIEKDARFEIVCPTSMGLVCFRMKVCSYSLVIIVPISRVYTYNNFVTIIFIPQGNNDLSEQLHANLMSKKKLYLITAILNGKFFLRFVVCSRLTSEEDIRYSWNEICSEADSILNAARDINGKWSFIASNEGNFLDDVDKIKLT